MIPQDLLVCGSFAVIGWVIQDRNKARISRDIIPLLGPPAEKVAIFNGTNPY